MNGCDFAAGMFAGMYIGWVIGLWYCVFWWHELWLNPPDEELEERRP